MKLYEKAAIMAIEVYNESDLDIKDAWVEALCQLTESKHSIEKCAPRAVFLSLCESGIVRGVPKGNYTNSIKNKKYASEAIELIRTLGLIHKEILWEMVTDSEGIKQNSQLDVVYALYSNGYID